MSPSPHPPDRHPAPGREVVVVHSSDLHVDDGYTERLHAGDGTRGLRRVLAAARAARADVVLLVGDVFEHNRLPLDLLQRSAELLREAGAPVVILPGNHDPAIAESVYHRGGMAEIPGVHVLGVTEADIVAFPDLGLEIWGHAHRDYADMEPLRAPPPRRGLRRIAVVHGHYEAKPDRSTGLRPSWLFGDDEIAATQADYVALGHWNRAAQVGDGSVPAYYSGSPELAGTVNVVRLTAGGPARMTRQPLSWD